MSYNNRTASTPVVNKWLKTTQGEFAFSLVKHIEYELHKHKYSIVDKYQLYEDAIHVIYTMFQNRQFRYQEQIL